MNLAYLDTSVLAAYYCPEELSGAVEKALLKTPRPAISQLVAVELYSAVSMKVRLKQLSSDAGAQVISRFAAHRAEGYFAWLPIDDAHYIMACEWLGRFNTPLRSADALHLAAAFVAGEEVLTTDRQMHGSAKKLAIPCRLIGRRA